ncbi:hypothetical protein SteCoe_30765 [Stentor coeruleus]|uniref:Uncharacterized protein n=1 Tax=Stentor coeruleus TaxID=5963 RepID=A0A1R2B2V4_9CILI|nr:hypothetical protein SteCoe_30765 [Stentor coeruleus]
MGAFQSQNSCSFKSCSDNVIAVCNSCFLPSSWCSTHIALHSSCTQHCKIDYFYQRLTSEESEIALLNLKKCYEQIETLKAFNLSATQQFFSLIQSRSDEIIKELDEVLKSYKYLEDKINKGLTVKVEFIKKVHDLGSSAEIPEAQIEIDKISQFYSEIHMQGQKYNLDEMLTKGIEELDNEEMDLEEKKTSKDLNLNDKKKDREIYLSQIREDIKQQKGEKMKKIVRAIGELALNSEKILESEASEITLKNPEPSFKEEIEGKNLVAFEGKSNKKFQNCLECSSLISLKDNHVIRYSEFICTICKFIIHPKIAFVKNPPSQTLQECPLCKKNVIAIPLASSRIICTDCGDYCFGCYRRAIESKK